MSYQLGDVVTSSKGIRSAPLTDAKGNPVFFTCPKALDAPFGASAFNDPDAVRKNICFRCDDDTAHHFLNIDAAIGSYIEDNATRLFKGKNMIYKPALQTKEDFAPLLRCKINMGGTRACRFWNTDSVRCAPPEDLKGCMLKPRIHIRGLWIMGGECGLQCEVTDCMCDELQQECPFN